MNIGLVERSRTVCGRANKRYQYTHCHLRISLLAPWKFHSRYSSEYIFGDFNIFEDNAFNNLDSQFLGSLSFMLTCLTKSFWSLFQNSPKKSHSISSAHPLKYFPTWSFLTSQVLPRLLTPLLFPHSQTMYLVLSHWENRNRQKINFKIFLDYIYIPVF